MALVFALALLTVGCLLGAGLTWLLLQGRLQHVTRLVQAEGEAERATLAERLRGREAEGQERTLYDRICTLARHFAELDRNLDRAVDAYNTTVGSLEVRVLPGARRFKELGAAAGEELPALPTLNSGTRTLRAPELDPLLAEQAGLPES